MRVGFQDADFGALAALWANQMPRRYHVGADLLRANTVESPLFDWGASSIETGPDGPVAFLAVKRSANPTLFAGPDKDQAHLTAIAFTEPGQGVDLIAAAKGVLRERGVYRLLFGQDTRHFFPGCPSECQQLRDFLIIEGFDEGAEVIDLERDLADYEPPPGCVDPLAAWAHDERPPTRPDKATVGPLAMADVPALKAFLTREFPGRWTDDTMRLVETEGRADSVFGLFLGDRMEGFAVTQQEGCRLPIGGAVWHLDLGPNWGALGPIGVSRKVRGKGLGHALLGASLSALKARGARRSIIDWTTLADFYGRHGFEPARTYRAFEFRLDLS